MLEYYIVFFLLTVSMLFYFKIADRYNIVDNPNERSSHTIITLRGGGIIYWVASLLYFLLNIKTNYLFFTGISLICIVSFYDDIAGVSNKIRAFIQFTSLSLILINLNAYLILPWYIIVTIYIIAVGIINAYNFMDGINGITGLYTLVVLGSFYYINTQVVNFENSRFIIYPMMASIIFLFFNYRRKARCFAGDVGSIAIAFWIIYLLLELCIETKTAIWILFLAVYGVDSVCTILHRLFLRQNIFKAHRLHFYQILSNEHKIDHRIVSLFYALTQSVASFGIIYLYNIQTNHSLIAVVILTPLALLYLFKFYILKKYKVL